MQCRELENRLEDWLDGRGSPELEAHLRTCAECGSLADQMQRLQPLLATLRQEPGTLDAAFWVRLRERIESTRTEEAFWTAFNALAARAAAVLAVLLLALSLLTLRQPQPEMAITPGATQEVSLLAGGQLTHDQILLSLSESGPVQ